MNNDEILLIQNYLRDLFDNEDISIRKEQDVPPSASLYVFSESIGSIQKDDDPDEEDISYSLTIPIDTQLLIHKVWNLIFSRYLKRRRLLYSDRGSIEDSKEVSILNAK